MGIVYFNIPHYTSLHIAVSYFPAFKTVYRGI